jgi:hypothetical protein
VLVIPLRWNRFHLGRRERGGEAMAVIEVDAVAGADTVEALRGLPEIIFVRLIELGCNRPTKKSEMLLPKKGGIL